MPRHRHRVHITVTREDIDGAIRNVSKHCAVATGIKASVEGCLRPQVDIQTIRWSESATGKRYIYLTPPIVADYIIAFDAGDKIEPFEFDLITPAYTGRMRRQPTGESDAHYHAIVNVPRAGDGKFAAHSGSEEAVPIPRSDVPRIVADREYGRRRFRQNRGHGGADDGGMPLA